MSESPSFIAVADVHLGKNLYNIPELGDDLKKAFSDVADLAIEKQVQYLVIVGDLFENNKPTPDLITFVASIVVRLAEKNITVVGVMGDHDKLVNDASWGYVSGISPVTDCPHFFGCDYVDTPSIIVDALRAEVRPEVHWIFLHAQVPTLWGMCQDKKTIDFSVFPVFGYYPNLKGVILGDIHSPLEGRLIDGNYDAYIGYCGSLGVTKSDEVENKTGVLYFDGTTLTRLRFPVNRDFVRFELTRDDKHLDTIRYLVNKHKSAPWAPPVFTVDYDADLKDKLKDIHDLYSVGFVHTMRKQRPEELGTERVNIRSELGTRDRIDAVLKHECQDEEMCKLASALLMDTDPKLVLDRYKREKLESLF